MTDSEAEPAPLITRLLSALYALLHPTLPYLVPLVVCLSFVPLILFFSASAGWFVWRTAAVSWQTPLYLQYGDGLPPYAEVALPKLVGQQRYDISLQLQVPNIESTYAIGNFMASLTLATRANKTIVSVRRPAIVIPPRVAFYALNPSIVTVHVPLLTAYATGASHVIAHLEVGRRDHWKSLGTQQGRELSVVEASLRGVVVHHGVRGLITRFPLLSGLVASVVFLTISSLIVAVCILPLAFRRLAAPTVADPLPELEPMPVQSKAKPEPLAVAISSDSESETESNTEEKEKPSRRTSHSIPSIKTEVHDVPTTLLADDVKPTPLRRRSKLVDPVSSDSDS